MRVFEIDGRTLSSLEDFAARVSGEVLAGHRWQGNLDALNDCLRGGFGTPDEGFVLRIKNSADLQLALGHAETVRWFEACVRTCHPSNRQHVLERLDAARRAEGPTLFDMLVAIIRDHGPGGTEAEDNVVLELV